MSTHLSARMGMSVSACTHVCLTHVHSHLGFGLCPIWFLPLLCFCYHNSLLFNVFLPSSSFLPLFIFIMAFFLSLFQPAAFQFPIIPLHMSFCCESHLPTLLFLSSRFNYSCILTNN